MDLLQFRTTNYQDTHRKYVAAYIKKLGLRFSVIVGVLVNTVYEKRHNFDPVSHYSGLM
jgi:hypothetical protein